MSRNGYQPIMIGIIKMSSYQRGVALIQVLLVTSILSVLALYMTQTAKSQIQQAKWMNNKAQAHIELHSAESELLFELFTLTTFLILFALLISCIL